MNFFLFDTIKDINVIIPEEKNDTERIINLYFENYEIFNKSAMQRLITRSAKFKKHLYLKNLVDYEIIMKVASVRERFAIKINQDIIGPQKYTNTTSNSIVGQLYCFHIQNQRYIVIYERWWKKLSKYFLSVNGVNSYLNRKRFFHRKMPTADRDSLIALFYAYSYTSKKLPWPYIDNCYDYTAIGYMNRLDAVTDCLNTLAFERNATLSARKVFKPTESTYGDYSIDADNRTDIADCVYASGQFDCDQSVYFVDVTSTNKVQVSQRGLYFHIENDKDASFFIESKPRIDNIDYVTYVLDAMGSWLGFTFLMLNPVPHFLKVKPTGIEPGIETPNMFNVSMTEFVR